MSDRVAVMNAGRFEQVGTPQELYHAPASAFVAGFVGDSNRWRGRVVAADRAGARVALGDGTTVTAAWGAGPLAEGAAAEVFVRPEAIRVGEGENALTGVVEGLLFNGASSRVLVRAAGELIEVDDPQQGTARRAAGEAVTLGWDAGQARAYPAG
jgi:spermidine/putrescine transport system ATP-binding protein